MKVFIGVDVGGTNTDAVVLYNRRIVAKCKQPTTVDVTLGVKNALSTVLNQLYQNLSHENVFISCVNIGTTHFLNAVLQRQNLVPVAVIRLCGPVSRAVPPFSDFPTDLKDVLLGGYYFIDGGYEFDGKEIRSVRREEVLHVISQLKQAGIKHVVVSGVFSSICANQEILIAQILQSAYPDASFTLSYKVAHMGLLERENSAILNESLKPLSKKCVAAFEKAVRDVGLKCPLFFTQNDGTIISAEKSSKFPVLTFSSGPTNSMRGAAFLSENKDAIVIDIGGTSTDVGVLVHGFPREASTRVKCGGVTTNFRMPDVLSIALGGGSLIRANKDSSKSTIGPDSVGYELVTKSKVYGGPTLTTTDIAVAAKLCKIGDPNKVSSLEKSLVDDVLSLIHKIIEDSVDQVKVTPISQPVILVGGGAVLVDVQRPVSGASVVVKPAHFEVANAVGAALSQVSGTVDTVVNLAEIKREEALREAEQLACARAMENGAQPETVVTVEKTDVHLTYLKGNATRIQVKAVGDLILPEQDEQDEQVLNSSALKHHHDFGSTLVFPVTKTLPDREKQVDQKEIKIDPQSVSARGYRPFVERSSGDWLLSEFDVECIATGAGILGCGGGGSPYLGRIKALLALKSGRKIRVIHPDNLPEKGLILGVGYMGAPLVLIEKLLGEHESKSALEKVQNVLNSDPNKLELEDSPHGVKYVKHLDLDSNMTSEEKKIVALMSLEIGGYNSIEPLILGGELGLPVVDCDGMGRAFPQLQMYIPSMYGVSICPCAVVGASGPSEVVTHATKAKAIEKHLREVVVTRMGCEAAIAMAPQTSEQLTKTCIMFSMSQAWHLGYAVKMAQKEKRCPVKAVLDVQNGKLLISGKIIDVERKTEGGFNQGNVKVDGFGEFSGTSLALSFQNENLLAEKVFSDGTRRQEASTPDLISVIDSNTGEPIPTEDARYGLRVSVIAIPCSPLLTQEKALEVVGPQAFGYHDHVYEPVGVYKQFDPIPQPVSVAHRESSRFSIEWKPVQERKRHSFLVSLKNGQGGIMRRSKPLNCLEEASD